MGSKCCKPDGPESAWYPVSKETECRKPSVQCTNRDGTRFECAAGDKCCGGACVGKHDVCCENVNGDDFPCQGEGGGCCGNACYAPGSKCCKPAGPKSAWYPVSEETECRKASVQCTNRNGDEFECAAGDQCCGDTCVSKDDVCCENVLGNNFPCQGNGGGCCGNACYAPGSKCCKSLGGRKPSGTQSPRPPSALSEHGLGAALQCLQCLHCAEQLAASKRRGRFGQPALRPCDSYELSGRQVCRAPRACTDHAFSSDFMMPRSRHHSRMIVWQCASHCLES